MRTTTTSDRVRRLWLCAILMLGGVGIIWSHAWGPSKVHAAPPAAAAAAGQRDPRAGLYGRGFKSLGAGTCSNAKCHGAPEGSNAGADDYVNPSFTLWN